MKKRILIIGGIVIILIIGIVIMTIMTAPKSTSTGTTSQTLHPTGVNEENGSSSTNTNSGSNSGATPSTTKQLTPNQVAAAFYQWYLTYPGNPLSSGAYEKSIYLTAVFKHEIGVLYSEAPNNDPVICPQNRTLDAIVQAPTYDATGQMAEVLIVSKVNGRYLHQINLVKSGATWLINDIICEP